MCLRQVRHRIGLALTARQRSRGGTLSSHPCNLRMDWSGGTTGYPFYQSDCEIIVYIYQKIMWFPDMFAAASTPPAGTLGDPGANRVGRVKSRDELAREVEVLGERLADLPDWFRARLLRRAGVREDVAGHGDAPALGADRQLLPRRRGGRAEVQRRRRGDAGALRLAGGSRHRQRARADLEALIETTPVGVVVIDARTGRCRRTASSIPPMARNAESTIGLELETARLNDKRRERSRRPSRVFVTASSSSPTHQSTFGVRKCASRLSVSSLCA